MSGIGRLSLLSSLLVALTLSLLALPASAPAQYMYLDANGDGIHTDADKMPASGSVTADVWLRTDQNRDGSPASCASDDGELTINSYEVILHARSGTVAYSDFTNHMADFTTSFGEASSATDYHNGFGGGTILAPGLYRLATVTITVVSFSPSIEIAASTPLGGGFTTSFGSRCSGADFDNTLKLGGDWHVADGLPSVNPEPRAPVWGPVLAMVVGEGEVADQTLTATDPDGSPLTFSFVSGPDFVTVTTVDPGTGTATGNVHVAPGPFRSGNYHVDLRVTDGIFQVFIRFGLDVTNRSLSAPILDPIPNVNMVSGSAREVIVPAFDADNDVLTFFKVAGPSFMGVSQQFQSGVYTGHIFLFPPLGSGGTYPATLGVTDGTYQDQESFTIFVDGGGPPVSRPPILYFLSDIPVLPGTTKDQTLFAFDPDNDPLTFALVSGPPFVTVTPLSPSGSTARANLHIAPGPNEHGAYPARVSVTDGHYIVGQDFTVTVLADRLPIDLLPIPDITMTQHTDSTIILEAVSLHAEFIDYIRVSGPSFLFPYNQTVLQGVVLIQPSLRTHVGTFEVTIEAQDEVSSDTETFFVTILPDYRPPGADVFWAFTPQIHTPVQGFVLTGDSDGDAITSVTLEGLPGATLVPEPNSGGEAWIIEWTPNALGTYPYTLTIVDASGMSATEERTVVVHSRPPVVTPSAIPAIPLRPISAHVNVVDPDGDPIQNFVLTVPTDLAALGATFTPDPGNTGGTFRWTPRIEDAPLRGSNSDFLSYSATDGDLTTFSSIPIRASYTDQVKLDVNAMDTYVASTVQVAQDVYTQTAGLVYPKGSGKTAVYGLGFWLAGKAGNLMRISRGGTGTEFFPGTIPGGVRSPWQPSFRCYRIQQGDVTSEDYLQWPVSDGAPVNAAGLPDLHGDQMVWSVSHDTEPGRRPPGGEYPASSTLPLGVEVRQSTFAFDGQGGPLSNVAFLRFEITNQSAQSYDSTFASMWSDIDVGDFADDLAGADPARDMAYMYNGDDNDAQYGSTAPAVGLAWLETPAGVAAPGTRLAAAISSYPGLPNYTGQAPANCWVMMQGKTGNGSPMRVRDQASNAVTTYRYDGDPVAGTGWNDPTTSDKRVMLTAGPLTLGAGQTVEYVAALLIGQGGSRLASVEALRDLVPYARYVAASGYVALPYVKASREVTVAEGSTLTLPVEALDLDGDPLQSLTPDLRALPLGHDAAWAVGAAGPGAPGGLSGILTWTPTFADAGTHVLRFTAANDRSATFEVTVHVTNVNRPPIADAGGPYSGVAPLPVALHATASGDPDGDALTYSWDFGDGASGAGASVQHAYTAGGAYQATVTVSDGTLSATDAAAVEIASDVAARAFAPAGKNKIKLAAARPLYCFQLEAVGSSFELTDVDPATLLLTSDGTGSVDAISGSQDKSMSLTDRNNNGAPEMTVCFESADLRRLFDQLPPGEQTVTVALEGAIASGVRFRAPFTVSVLSSRGLASLASPNPLAQDGTLTFRLTRGGPVRVTMLDVSGRVIDTMTETVLEPGYHQVPLRTRGRDGRKLASGVYFFSIEAAEGSERGRVIIVK